MIGKYMEVYIDDIVVKSQDFDKHLENLEKGFHKNEEASIKDELVKMCLWCYGWKLFKVFGT